jgi:hypothetical protein
MGCDYYTEDDGGEFVVEARVWKDGEIVNSKELRIEMPPDAELYLDENIGDCDTITGR